MYRYTRKEVLQKLGFNSTKNTVEYFDTGFIKVGQLVNLLLAQKEDRKECKYIRTGKYTAVTVCPKCLGKNGCMCDLRPTPSPKKECKHEKAITNGPPYCVNCGELLTIGEMEKPCTKCTTPSPLEIEEIRNLDTQGIVERMCQNKELLSELDAMLMHKVNKLIYNQKKLYQYIKEKKI